MSRHSHAARWAAVGLAVACMLPVVAARAAPDPDLQIHIDFDSYEPFWDHRSWMFHDQSPNGFDVDMGNLGWDLALAPGALGQALECSWAGIGAIETDREPLYERGEGVTITVWARLIGAGMVWPIHVGTERRPIITTTITRSEDGLEPQLSRSWRAIEEDAETLAFISHAQLAVTDEWFHYAAVYDPAAAVALIYLDGDEVARVDADGEPASNWGERQPVSDIGTRIDSLGDAPAYVDELRMYSRALTQDEIRGVMHPDGLPVASPAPALATRWGALRRP